MYRLTAIFLWFFMVAAVTAQTPEIREYIVKRTSGPITIDGKLSESGWQDAADTKDFVIYTDGSAPIFPTKAKMLWDNDYLYVAFIMTDRDVWGKMTSWHTGDPCLCLEEVAEVFIDPDGDGYNYIEIEVNPLKTVMDLTMSKEYGSGGKGDFDWNLNGLKIGVWVDGTLNDSTDVDKKWVCELAFPFKEIAFCAPSKFFPPKSGDSWRLNLYRYEYGRIGDNLKELSAWNKTDAKRGFHAPDRFGRIVFSEEVSK